MVTALKRKLPFYLAVLLCLCVAAVSGYKVFSIVTEYRAGEDTSSELQQYIQIAPTQPDPTQPTLPPSTEAPEDTESAETMPPEPTEDPFPYPEVDFETLQSINPDVIGWIYIEGTKINYPVVQGTDNDRYLSVMADGTRNAAGSIFMDYRNEPDFSDRHTVIYGHNMRNGTMFHGIRSYSDPAFLAEHPEGMIMTPEKNFRFEIIGGYVAKPDSNAWELSFNSGEEFSQWLQDTMSRSTVNTGVTPTTDDRIITLSTCSYEFNNARYVLICRVIT